jgi:hypothetical protein
VAGVQPLQPGVVGIGQRRAKVRTDKSGPA